MQNFIQQTDSTKRVQAWHDLIQPRLQEAESRKEFDIHLYGSNILETFGNEEPLGSVMHFSQIVGREPKNEVARYFLATLQLVRYKETWIWMVFNWSSYPWTDTMNIWTILSHKFYVFSLVFFPMSYSVASFPFSLSLFILFRVFV